MTFSLDRYGPAFKRAMIASGIFHAVILAVLIVNPRLPQSSRPGALRYVTLNLGGGGSGGRGGSGGPAAAAKLAATPIEPGTLRDLTTAAKLKADEPNRMRFPTDKPKREPKPKPDKKAAVTKPAPGAKPAEAAAAPAGTATGAPGGAAGGSGLTIGVGGGGGTGGEGFGFGGELGLSDFPYAYYLVAVRDKISANWIPSIADLGGGGTLRTVVYFRIFRNGSISTVDVRESSGLQAFDLNARRAVANAAPFPPLPADYDDEHLGIFLAFENIR